MKTWKRLIILLALLLAACSPVQRLLVAPSQDNIVIRGQDISGAGITCTGANWIIEGNFIHNTSGPGINLGTNCVNAHVDNNVIDSPEWIGIQIQGRNNLVEYNEIRNVLQRGPLWPGSPPWPSWIDADGIHFFGNGHTIRGNYIHDIHYGTSTNSDAHTDCFQTYSGGGDYIPGYDILIEGNTCILPERGGGFASKMLDSEFGHDITVRGNVANSPLIGLLKSGYNFKITNNTFIGSPTDPETYGWVLTNTTNTVITGNIFAYQQNGLGTISTGGTSPGLTAGDNCVYAAGRKPARPADPGDIWGLDPLLTSDYHLKAGSPCIGFGAINTIQSSVDAASSGSTVVIHPGNYNERVKITKDNITLQCAVADTCITLGFDVWGNGDTIDGFQIYKATLVGVEVRGSNNTIINNEVWNTLFNGTDSDGMRFFGTGHIFRNNYIHDIPYTAESTAHIDCWQTWAATDRGGAGRNSIFENNICVNLVTQTIDESGSGFMLEGGADNNMLRGNLIRAHGCVKITASDGIKIINNTCASDLSSINSPTGIWTDGATNLTIKYNIFADIASNGNLIKLNGSTTGFSGGNNLFYRSDGVIPVLSSTYVGTNDLKGVDPKFIDPKAGNYHLQAISPACNLGAYPCSGSVTITPGPTSTVTIVKSITSTVTKIPTSTITKTITSTPTSTSTSTVTIIPTFTMTASPTVTITPSPTVTPIPVCSPGILPISVDVIIKTDFGTLNLRLDHTTASASQGLLFSGTTRHVLRIWTDCKDYWGELGDGLWIGLRVSGFYYSDWRP